jgi:hypothetical protein
MMMKMEGTISRGADNAGLQPGYKSADEFINDLKNTGKRTQRIFLRKYCQIAGHTTPA